MQICASTFRSQVMGPMTFSACDVQLSISIEHKSLPLIQAIMKLYLAPYLAAIGIAACAINRVDASIARSSFSVGRKASFGLSSEVILGKIPRGGSEEAEVDADVPEVLYLPGLLEATIVKRDKVRLILSCF
jgi:hypothetical protein